MSRVLTVQVEDFKFHIAVDSNDDFGTIAKVASDTYRGIFPHVPKQELHLTSSDFTFLPPNGKLSTFDSVVTKDGQTILHLKPLPQTVISKFTQLEHPKKSEWTSIERDLRIKLAAAYRLFELFGWSEIMYNHLTAKIPGTNEFLINPFGLHFSEITASSLVKIDINGNIIDRGSTGFGINSTGYVIHGAIHRAREDIGAVFHTHSVEGTAVSSMEVGFLHNLNQVSSISGQPAYHDYEGLAVSLSEQATLVRDLGDKRTMILRNHGLLSCGSTIEEAFLRMFYLSTSCKVQVATLSSVGLKGVKLLSEEISQFTNQAAFNFSDKSFGEKEFSALTRVLDTKDSSYKI